MRDDTEQERKFHSPSHRTPFIGRLNDLSKIEARLETTLDRRGGGLAVQGISGVGKTRLLFAVVEEAEKREMRVIYLPCRGTRFRPSDPIAVLVRTLLDIDPQQPRDRQQKMLRQHLEHLNQASLLPLFSEVLGVPVSHSRQTLELDSAHDVTLPRADALFVTPERLNLPDSLLRIIETLTRQGQSFVIIADDLDEGHEATRDTLIALAGDLLKLPALLIASFAPEAPAALRRAFGGSVIELGPFDRTEMLTMANSIIEAHFDDPAADELWSATDGFPLLLWLAVTLLQREGRVIVDDDGGSASLNAGRKIPAIGRMLLDLADDLPEDLRDLLNYAAVLTDGFRIGAIGSLSEQPLSDTLNTRLVRLYENGWLDRSGSERRATYRFPNRVTRQVIYQAIDPDTREVLHRRAGDYYAVPSTGRRMRTENALYHYLSIHDVGRGLDVIEMALTQAKQGDDLNQLIALYQQGVELAGSDPQYHDRQLAMSEALGDLLTMASDYRQASEAYSRHLPADSPVMMQAKLGLVLLAVDPVRAVKELIAIIPLIPKDAPRDLYFRVEAGLVWGLAQGGQMYEAIRRSRDVLGALADTTGFGSARTLVRGTLGMAMHYYDDPIEAQTHLESARAGWSARGEQDGILLINQILLEVPANEITRIWLKYVVNPLIDSRS